MKVLFLTIFILILLICNVNALGVVSDFLEDDTLELIKGTSKLFNIRIQNPDQQEIIIKLTYDENILKVINYQDEYKIPPKTNYQIEFNVSPPKNAKLNQIYTVGYTIHQLSGSGPGLPILLKIAKNFKLKIIKNPNKFYISDYYKYIPNIAIILVVILFLIRKELQPKLDKLRKKFRKNKIKNRKIIKRKL